MQQNMSVQMGNVDLPQKNEDWHGQSTSKLKNTPTKKWNKCTGCLEEDQHIKRKQTPPIQSSTQTHMDLWISAMGDRLQFQHQNPPALSIQDSLTHSARTLVHKEQPDPFKSTTNTVLSEIKMWNIEYLTTLMHLQWTYYWIAELYTDFKDTVPTLPQRPE
jgi:hypothetical protein